MSMSAKTRTTLTNHHSPTPWATQLASHKVFIDHLLHARKDYMKGECFSYFNQQSILGWCYRGDESQPKVCVLAACVCMCHAHVLKYASHTPAPVLPHICARAPTHTPAQARSLSAEGVGRTFLRSEHPPTIPPPYCAQCTIFLITMRTQAHLHTYDPRPSRSN